MPSVMQAKLLRVLETRATGLSVPPKSVTLVFRLIAATHQPLTRHVEEGVFRADLYHRLCQCLLLIAPLQPALPLRPYLARRRRQLHL